MGLVKGWLNGPSNCYTLHPITQPLSGRLEMSSIHRTPRRRQCFSLREGKISLCVLFSQENNRKVGMTVKGDWHFIESQSPARCCSGFRMKSWGRTPEGVWHASPGVWRCLWTEAGVWLELPWVVIGESSVWREGSKCQTLPAGQEVCLEATTESSWKNFPACADCLPGVGPQQKEAVDEPWAGTERDEPEGPLPASAAWRIQRRGLTGEIWHLGSSNWQVFYRPEDHRRIGGHFLFLFLPFASFHSLAAHTFLSAGLRGKASH